MDDIRQEFEAAADALPEGVSWGDSLTPEIAMHILALRTPSAAGVVPEGWKLVPIEPTQEQLEAVRRVDCDGSPASYRTIYTVAVAAAPAAPIAQAAVPAEQGGETDARDELMRVLTEYEGALQEDDEEVIAPARKAMLDFLAPIRAHIDAAPAPHSSEAATTANDALERAALLAEQWGNARMPDGGGNALRNCAEAIRALKNAVSIGEAGGVVAEPVAEVTNYRDVDGDLQVNVVFRGKTPPAGTLLFAAQPQAAPSADAPAVLEFRFWDVQASQWGRWEPATVANFGDIHRRLEGGHQHLVRSVAPRGSEDYIEKRGHPTEVRAALREAFSRALGLELHTDDLAVAEFAAVMAAKLGKKRADGYDGWPDKALCPAVLLSQMLREHVEKSDPVDVANLAMMLHLRGERIEPVPPAAAPETPMVYPEEMTTALRHVLSKMCFEFIHIARLFRDAGIVIETSAEAEQSHCLHWLIKLVLKHGDQWATVATDELKQLHEVHQRAATQKTDESPS